MRKYLSKELEEYFVDLRHRFHSMPELAYEENQTSTLVCEELERMGIEYERGLAGTGVIARIGTDVSDQAIMLRADMDALPIDEETGLEYASKNPGVMHACGHDGHMTMLLAAASVLKNDPDLGGVVYLLFQPAEEGGAGAKKLIDDGLFDRYDIDRVFGLHNHPTEKYGRFMIKKGPIMASIDTWTVTVKGRSGHSSQPHRSINPIVVASHIVLAIKSISSLYIDPSSSHVVTVTKIEGGTTFNIIPDICIVHGSARCFDDGVRMAIRRRIEEISHSIAAGFGADVDVEYNGVYPVTSNSVVESARAAARKIGAEVSETHPPSMGSEDFSFFLQHTEGCYVWLGSEYSDGRDVFPLHSSRYDFNDDLIQLGASYWIELAKAELPPPQ